MTQLLLSWLVLSVGMWLTAAIVPGFEVKSARGAVLVAAVFGVLHWAIGWLLFVIIGIGTLGIGLLLGFVTRWIVTAILLKVTDALLDTLKISSFKSALLGAVLLSVLSAVKDVLLG